MKKPNTLTLKIYLLSVLLFVGAVAHSEPVLINGAGATFPYPLYSKWFSEYAKVDTNAQFNYQSIGSGGGIKKFSEGTVDFGATDSPMTDEQIAGVKEPLHHIPTALGAVVLTFNLEGVKELQLTAATVAGIFLGTISKWNDAALKKENPKASLPDLPIVVVHRSDGSGTSGIFTDYLSKVSAEWKGKVGQGTAVNWPAGLGGKGNEGVTGLVKQTPGSIGYVELIYAETNKLTFANLENAAKNKVHPSLASVTAAAKGVKIPDDYRVSITNAPGKDAYPISGFTYLLVSKSMKGDKGKKIVEFLKWSMQDGQKINETLSYARLPDELNKRVQKTIASIQVK